MQYGEQVFSFLIIRTSPLIETQWQASGTEDEEEREKKRTQRTTPFHRKQRSKQLDFQNKSSSRNPIVGFKSRNKQASYPRIRPSEQVFWSNPEKPPTHKSRMPHFPGQLQIVTFRPTTSTNYSLVTPFLELLHPETSKH